MSDGTGAASAWWASGTDSSRCTQTGSPMVPLYTLFLAGLGGLKWVLAGRAARAERKYTAAALVAEQAARQAQVKPGNASGDPLAQAKRYYELGRLVDDRDVLEGRYHASQDRADRA